MLSDLFFFPPVLLKICRLGCLQLAHKPETWHLNPFIKSWALKWAEDRSWTKDNYSLDQDQWGFTPRIKPPELGVSQIQALMLAISKVTHCCSVIFHEVGEVSLKNQNQVASSRAGYRGVLSERSQRHFSSSKTWIHVIFEQLFISHQTRYLPKAYQYSLQAYFLNKSTESLYTQNLHSKGMNQLSQK